MGSFSLGVVFCVFVYCIPQASPSLDPDDDVFETLSILEDEIYVLTRDMELLERKRKADRDILMREMRSQLEQTAHREFSNVLLDKVKSGEISGLVQGDVLTETRSFRKEMGQLKTTMVKTLKDRVPPSKPNLSLPRPAPELKKIDIQRMVRRVLGRRVKNVENKVKSLQKKTDTQNKVIDRVRSTLDDQGIGIQQIKDGFTDQKNDLQDLRDLVKDQRNMIEQLQRDLKNGGNVAAKKETSGVTEVEKKYVPITRRIAPTTSSNMKPDRVAAAMEGEEVTLVCVYRGYDSPMIMWQYNGIRIAMDERIVSGNRRMSILRPYSGEWNLRISPVLDNDAGTYSCKKLHPAPAETITYNLIVRGQTKG